MGTPSRRMRCRTERGNGSDGGDTEGSFDGSEAIEEGEGNF